MTHSVPIKLSDRRRVKAFRVPWSFVADCVVGYQGSASTFKIHRMNPELLPEGFVIVGAWVEHPRNDLYFQVSHPSFPEVVSGEKLEATEITIEWIDVKMVEPPAEEITLFDPKGESPDVTISVPKTSSEQIRKQYEDGVAAYKQPVQRWALDALFRGEDLSPQDRARIQSSRLLAYSRKNGLRL